MKKMKIWLTTLALIYTVSTWGQGWLKTYGNGIFPSRNDVTILNYNKAILLSASESSLRKIDSVGIVTAEKLMVEKYPNVIMSLPNDDIIVAGVSYVFANDTILDPEKDSAFVFMRRMNSNLEEIWDETLFSGHLINELFAISSTPNGDIIALGRYGMNYPDIGTILIKASNSGSLIHLDDEDAIFDNNHDLMDMVITLDGNIAVVGRVQFDPTQFGADSKYMLAKLDLNGDVIWEKIYDNEFRLGSIVSTPDGGFIVTGGDISLPSGNPRPVICIKVNSDGDIIWQKTWTDIFGTICDIQPAQGGGYFLLGDYLQDDDKLKLYDIGLIKIDENGNELWRKSNGTLAIEVPEQFIQTQDGSLLICGISGFVGGPYYSFLAKTDSLGNLYTSTLSGTLHQDPQSDCLPDPTEPGLAGWLVQATGAQSFATLTDSFGHFTLPVDTGSYEVTVTPSGPYWEVCNSPATVAITEFYDTLFLDFPAQAIADCPYLTVDISAPFLRRCFDNNYYVHYCNDGTITAEDATVEVTLDPYFTYVSSTLPPASQNGNTLTFDLGDVAVGDCGSFQITAYLDCDSTILGQTHCTSAHISPDSLCLQPDPLWDGSSIEVDASCSGDSVVFTITNVGSEGMPAPLGFIIIEDQIVLLTNDFQLGAGQSTTVSVPANGGTFHLEAQQAAAHPSGFASTGATIEGCGSWLSLGFFTQWSFDDDPDPFTDVDCQANIGSFDPNDKQGFPTGLGDEHLIEPGQDLEYLIRFQNTGTDTAFKVTVVDVLPPELDLATVRPGASSHPYTYGVTPEGWLTFTFDNIQLPDSTTNEAASHGFVHFRASQRAGLSNDDLIANTALIYFDFNAPVLTNTFIHRIGQVFPWTVLGDEPPVLQPKTNVRIVPNPLTDSALLQVEGIEPGPLNLVLTDVSGKVLRQQTVNGTGFEFQRGELNPGLYFFKIERNGERVGSGKLMVR